MSDKSKTPAPKKSPLRLNKETVKDLRTRTGVRTGGSVQITGPCFVPSANCGTIGCLTLSNHNCAGLNPTTVCGVNQQ